MLQKIRNATYQYAIPSAVVIAILFYGIMLGVSELLLLLPSSTVTSYLKIIVGMLYPVGFMIFFGFSNAFRSKKFFKGLVCGIVLVVMQIIVLLSFFVTAAEDSATVWNSWDGILMGLLFVIGIGVREECVFRGTIQNILAKKYASSIKGIWITAIVSAVIFGLIHLFNILAGVDAVPAIIQSLTNFGIGLFYAALYLRSGNIWVMISIHALTDTAGLASSVFLANQSETEVISSLSVATLISGLVFVGVSIFLLRPSKCKEILARFGCECGEPANKLSADATVA